ncbi:MAG: ice-binding family protein [Archangium sp.]|nr:ice-binding family protein [Archangium sp.]
MNSKLLLSCLVFSLAGCDPSSSGADGGKLPDGGNPPTGVVNLGTAGSFAILAKSAISTVPGSVITGDLGVSPAAATFVTGFSLVTDATNTFSTSPQVTGKIYASDYTPPTPTRLTTAVGDMELAFTAAAGRPAAVTELGAGDIGGMTLKAGVYKWGTGLLIPTNVTLSGSATDVWVFQVAQDLTVSNGMKVLLSGGALPRNIFWQVAGRVELGTTSHLEGIVLSQTAITLGTGASINGRLLAQTAVSLDANTVVQP